MGGLCLSSRIWVLMGSDFLPFLRSFLVLLVIGTYFIVAEGV